MRRSGMAWRQGTVTIGVEAGADQWLLTQVATCGGMHKGRANAGSVVGACPGIGVAAASGARFVLCAGKSAGKTGRLT